MARINQITPFVMTRDLAASLEFYTGILGFTCGFQQDNYAFVHHRPGGALRLIEVDPDCEIGEQMIYLDCEDVDAVWTVLKPRLDTLPEERVRAPFDQPYRMREFHVKDPDNCLLLYGTDIPPSP
ncbi:VOC family protein [Roseobacter ponti]|uniref:VOC family protein n=1 Tax=Roseobacter ponti TaxID=1891787 RepID=A0A858SRE5_9RHOB|nr:VOC family protein [Roseobacter ponti]QJF50458.1 VOC family protein [Roseobacter ponti]